MMPPSRVSRVICPISFRPGFSLLELMIAIMILGIGVVMVATVFPVGLEISRDTIQTTLAAPVAESALNTLLTKVPFFKPIDDPNASSPNPPNATARVLVPNVAATDLDTDIDDQDIQVLSALNVAYAPTSPVFPPVSYRLLPLTQFWTAVPPTTSIWVGLNPAPQTFAQYIDHTRVFTARTGWSAELNSWLDAAVMPSGNLPADLAARTALLTSFKTGSPATPEEFRDQIPTMVLPTIITMAQPDLPRVNLVDQVYPPVELTNTDGSGRTATFVLNELFNRRYMWMAFQRLSITTSSNLRSLSASLAILHRADLYVRFPRQASLPSAGSLYDVRFDLGNPTHRVALLRPQPDSEPLTDSVFPRPWLALVHFNYDPVLDAPTPQPGTVTCSAEVARLLPAGSFFIIARSTPQNNPVYLAGRYFPVLRSEWDPAALASTVDPHANASSFPWAQVEIPKTNAQPAQNVLVWVFPPGITRTSPVEFQTRSPLIGVAPRSFAIK